MDYEQIKELYSTFIIQRTYTRFDDNLGRRETWEEAVNRYANFLSEKVPSPLQGTFKEAIQAIKDKQIMPSMRLLWTAGRAAQQDPVCAYNCGFIAVTDIKVFSEMMYLLMNGVGVGFSVERQFICKLPEVSSEQYPDQAQCYTVEDSKEGWALTYKSLIRDWYHGIPSTWNVSKVRPKGTPIKGFGGRASGPEVLVDLFNFTKNIIYYASGRKLNSKELADIICKIADIVIAGGVRRSATICLSNLSDQRMKHFKEGQFWQENPQRQLANISVAYTEKPDVIAFMEEMRALIVSNTGERGLINVEAFPDEGMRTNPCGERVLRSRQLCNLTEVVVDYGITYEELARRITLATFLGTLQATLTEFNTKVLSKDWVKNTKEDAMLGVSLTGVSNITWNPHDLEKLQDLAKAKNKEYAQIFKINPAYGITCNKPSGCQTPETLLITNKGILTLEEIGDIHGDTWQEHDLVIAQEKDSAKSTKFYNNGKTLVKRLYMASGVNLEATLNHQYRVLDKGQYVWKAVKDIVEGDIIPYRVGGYGESTQQHFYQSLITTEAPYHNCKPIIQPLKLNEDIAYLLGLYTGDGSNHGKGIRIAGNYKDQAPLIKAMDIAKKHFGIEGTIYTRNKGENADLYLNSTWLLSFLQANGLSKDKTEFIDIPKLIRMSPKSVIEAFIEGYADADGCVTAQGEIVICTISEKMAKTLPIVWRAIGQDCTVKLMPPTQTSWGSKMRYRITAIKGRQGDYCKDTQRVKHFKELDTLNLTTLNPDTVIGVEYYESTTHDIEVPENNTYVANSYISHNTVSQVVGVPSGIHPDYAPFYIRRVRVSRADPICTLLVDSGVPYHPEVGTNLEDATTYVFEWPTKSNSLRVRNNCSALEQLRYYKLFKKYWCDERGNPSCTIYVKDNEWIEVINWLFNNWEYIGGLSFLPYSTGVYRLTPYEEITEEQFHKLCDKFPNIDYSKLAEYEREDRTEGSKEYACSAGGCELI